MNVKSVHYVTIKLRCAQINFRMNNGGPLFGVPPSHHHPNALAVSYVPLALT